MTNAANSTKPILVLGGTGKTGRRVVQAPQSARHRDSSRVALRHNRPSTGKTGRRGHPRCAASGRSTSPTIRTSRRRTPWTPWARSPSSPWRTGVPRLVLLSGRGEHEAEVAEQTVRDSGAEFTIMRSTWFSQNFSEDYMLEHVLRGEVALPAGDVPEPFVDADDIADVAVEALTDDRHIGELYELTGPRLLTFADAVSEISNAARREIRFVPVSIEQHAAVAAEQGVPGDVIELLTYLFGEVLDGRNAHLGRRRPTRARPRAAQLRRVRAGRCGHRRVERRAEERIVRGPTMWTVSMLDPEQFCRGHDPSCASPNGAHVGRSRRKSTVDGPFAETKEWVLGCDVPSSRRMP